MQRSYYVGLTFIIRNTLNQKWIDYCCDEVTEAVFFAIVQFKIESFFSKHLAGGVSLCKAQYKYLRKSESRFAARETHI